MIIKLIKFNTWLAYACGIFALLLAPQIVDTMAVAMGARADRILTNQVYFIAVALVRVVGVMMFAYAFLIRMLLKRELQIDNLRQTGMLLAIGALVWTAAFLFLLPTRSATVLAAVGVGLLEWLAIPVLLIFEYKKTDSWQSVKPPES